MITGVLLFAVVAHFVLRQSMATSEELPPVMINALLGVALAACALSLLLRSRVPRRSGDEPVDRFWARATTPALLAWAPLEIAGLLTVFLYARTGAQSAVVVAAVAMLLFAVTNPGYFERRQ
jgi:hypothetical protein